MPNKLLHALYGLAEGLSFFMGVVLLFGTIFFWQSGGALIHIYSVFSFAALSIGAILLFFKKLVHYVFYIRVVNFIFISCAIIVNKYFEYLAFFLVGVALMSAIVSWRNGNAKNE